MVRNIHVDPETGERGTAQPLNRLPDPDRSSMLLTVRVGGSMRAWSAAIAAMGVSLRDFRMAMESVYGATGTATRAFEAFLGSVPPPWHVRSWRRIRGALRH